MGVSRLIAALAALSISGLCAAGQGLRAQGADDAWNPYLEAFGKPRAQTDPALLFDAPARLRPGPGRPGSGLGLVHELPGGWSTSLGFAAGEPMRERPQYGLVAQIGVELGAGWGLSFGMQQHRHQAIDFGTGSVTVERLFGNQQISFTLSSRRPEERAFGLGHRVQWSYRVGDRGFFGLSLAQGPDLDGIALEGAPLAEARNVTLFGRYWFMPNWAVSASAETQEQVGFARRNGIRFGLHHQF